MGTFVFLVVSFGLILIDKYRNKQLMSPLTVMIVPYMIIVAINNFYAVRFGFYPITNKVCSMLLFGFVMFFIGGSFLKIKPVIKNDSAVGKLKNYNVKAMGQFTVVIEIIIIIKFITALRLYSLAWFIADANEGYLMEGIAGHLMLTFYATLPIIFIYWLKNKKEYIYLLISLIGVGLMFMTFVKYHAICLIVLMYLVAAAEDRKYLKKGAVFIVIACFSTFVFSYFFTFLLRGKSNEVQNSFYIYHLWKYIGGSVINDNLIFSQGLYTDVDIFYKLGGILFTFPNMFITALGFTPICHKTGLQMYAVSSVGEYSNVIDFIGYLFPSKGGVLDIILFAFVMLVFGFISRLIYCRFRKKDNRFTLTGWAYLLFFCFFSFFGVYGALTNPWEIMIDCAIIPAIFSGKIVLGGLSLGNARYSSNNT